MIGHSEWFQRRKYGGWGLSPKTWQGWLYIVLVGGVAYILLQLPVADNIRYTLAYIYLAIMCLDLLHIMATLKKDEMEVKIEAFAERNASWAMIAVIAVGVAYQSAQSAVVGHLDVDWFLIATLVGGLIAKAATNFWLERKGV